MGTTLQMAMLTVDIYSLSSLLCAVHSRSCLLSLELPCLLQFQHLPELLSVTCRKNFLICASSSIIYCILDLDFTGPKVFGHTRLVCLLYHFNLHIWHRKLIEPDPQIHSLSILASTYEVLHHLHKRSECWRNTETSLAPNWISIQVMCNICLITELLWL